MSEGPASSDIVAEHGDLRTAFELAAEETYKRYRPPTDSAEEVEDFFRQNPFKVRLEIVVQPHNQWVKAYRVIVPGA